MRTRTNVLWLSLALAGAPVLAHAASEESTRPRMSPESSWLFGIWEKTADADKGGKEFLWFDADNSVIFLDEKHAPKGKGSFKMEGKSVVVTGEGVSLRLNPSSHRRIQGNGKVFESRR
jgi:hypothetical protein